MIRSCCHVLPYDYYTTTILYEAREFMTTGDFALLQPEEWDAMLQVDTRSI